jgi:tetratricopeptide (TPR) repeat protein
MKANEAGLAIQRKLADDHPTVIKYRDNLAASYHNMGLVLARAEKPAEALKSFERAAEILQKLLDDQATVTQYQNMLASCRSGIGIMLRELGKPVEALESLESAMAIQRKLADEHPTITEYQSNLAISQCNAGQLLSETGKKPEAMKSYESAVAILQKLADQNPAIIEYKTRLAHSQIGIGQLLIETGKSAEALKVGESAVAIRRKLAREHPESSELASELGAILNDLALIDIKAKRFPEARVRLEEAVVWQRKALASSPTHPTYRQFLDNHLTNLIRATREQGDSAGLAEAERGLAALRDSDPAMSAFDALLGAVIKGDQQPKDEAERLALAQRAYDRAFHATAERLWGEALANNPKLAEDRQATHAYNAACAAALAGCGNGRDQPPPDDVAKAKLRKCALNWLKAELALWSKDMESDGGQAKQAVVQALKHWQEDPDLAGVRDAKELAWLPNEDQANFKRLWTDVDALLSKALNRR